MSYAWVFAIGKVCLECGYELRGLPVADGRAICPECGDSNPSDYEDRSNELKAGDRVSPPEQV